MSEESLHRAVVAFLRLALPDGAVLHHSPNESTAGKTWRAKQKGLGCRTGWPDLEIIHGGRAIFIELKSKTGRVRPTQQQVHRDLTLAGAVVCVARSVDEVGAFLKQLMPLRARVQ